MAAKTTKVTLTFTPKQIQQLDAQRGKESLAGYIVRVVKARIAAHQAVKTLMAGPDSPLSDAEISQRSSKAVNKVHKNRR